MNGTVESMPCPMCSCSDARGAQSHALLAALAEDDLDRALSLGLLEFHACPACGPACAAALAVARDARHRALAARARYRARNARLQRRADELLAKRATPPASGEPKAPSLPAAAAAALARAKAKAAGNEPK